MFMQRKRVLYCWDCGKDPVHTFIERDTIGKGTGPFRVLLAVASAGVSEMTVSASYQCERCDGITRCGS